MLRTIVLYGLTFGTMVSGGSAVAQATGELLIVNQGDHSLSFLDSTTGKVAVSVPVAAVTGHEVAVTPDGRTAFVPIYGDSGVGRPGTDGSTIAVVDVRARKLTGTIDLGHGVRPHHPVYDRRRDLLYVTTELDRSVSVIDPRSLKVVSSIPTGEPESHMLALSHDGKRGYTANVGTGTVSVLDLATRKLITVIPIAPKVQRIAISSDDRMVFTSDQTRPQLAVIDTATNKVSRMIALPGLGYGAATTADGRYLLLALREDGKLAVVDLQGMAVVRTLEVGKGPVEVLVRPDGRAAYVSCSPEAKIAEVMLDGTVADWHVSRMMPAGTGADGLAWVGR